MWAFLRVGEWGRLNSLCWCEGDLRDGLNPQLRVASGVLAQIPVSKSSHGFTSSSDRRPSAN